MALALVRQAVKVAEGALEATSSELARVRALLLKLDDKKKRRNVRIHESRGDFADAQRSLKHIKKVKDTLHQFRGGEAAEHPVDEPRRKRAPPGVLATPPTTGRDVRAVRDRRDQLR